jgi:hypothetical protein
MPGIGSLTSTRPVEPYHGSNFVGCFRSSFQNPGSTGQLFSAFHWHLFRLPALAGSGFLRVGPISSPCASSASHLGFFLDFDGSFEPCELTTTIFPRFEPFSLVQHFSKIGIFGSGGTFCFTTRQASSSPRPFSSFEPVLRTPWTALSSVYRHHLSHQLSF